METVLGICIGIAAILGLLLGIYFGKGSAAAQSRALAERIAAQEIEIARLNGLNSSANEQNLQLRESSHAPTSARSLRNKNTTR